MSLLYHLAAILVAACFLAGIARRWLREFRRQGKLATGIVIIAVCAIILAVIGWAFADALMAVLGGPR